VAVLFAVTSAVICCAGVTGLARIDRGWLRWTAQLGFIALCLATFGPLSIEVNS
jgi:hypothetical protein